MLGIEMDKHINIHEVMEEIILLARSHQQLPKRELVAKILDKANEVYYFHALYAEGADLAKEDDLAVKNDCCVHNISTCIQMAHKYLNKISNGVKQLKKDPCQNECHWILIRTMADKFIAQGRKEKRELEKAEEKEHAKNAV